MTTRIILGLMIAAAALPTQVFAKDDSASTPQIAASVPHIAAAAREKIEIQSKSNYIHRKWGPLVEGRWHGGHRAPGGWNAYKPAERGSFLSVFWVAPEFYVGNYAQHGLPQPHPGTAWSRYYDDAVMIDGRGHVYDTVAGIDWHKVEDETPPIAPNAYPAYPYPYAVQQTGYGQIQAGYPVQQQWQNGQVQGAYPVQPQWQNGQVLAGYQGGYGYAGYGAMPMMGMTMIPMAANTTTTTTYYDEEVVNVPVTTYRTQAAAKKTVKPKAKPRAQCACK